MNLYDNTVIFNSIHTHTSDAANLEKCHITISFITVCSSIFYGQGKN